MLRLNYEVALLLLSHLPVFAVRFKVKGLDDVDGFEKMGSPMRHKHFKDEAYEALGIRFQSVVNTGAPLLPSASFLERGSGNDMTMGFEVEWNPRQAALTWMWWHEQKLWDHAVLFRTPEVNFTLETQGNVLESNKGAILEAISRPFKVKTEEGYKNLMRALQQVRKLTSEFDIAINESKGMTRLELFFDKYVDTWDDYGLHITEEGVLAWLVFCMKTQHNCTQNKPNPQVTVSHAYEAVWDVFHRGFTAGNCGSAWRTKFMQECATQALRGASLLGVDETMTDKDSMRVKGFFTILVQGMKAILAWNLPRAKEGPACRSIANGVCVARGFPHWSKDYFGLLPKTPLPMLFSGLSRHVQNNLRKSHVQNALRKWIYAEFAKEYNHIKSYYQHEFGDEYADEFEDLDYFDVADFELVGEVERNTEGVGNWLDMMRAQESGSVTISEYLDIVFREVDDEEAETTWKALIGDETSNAIIYRTNFNEEASIRPVFEYRQIRPTIDCLNTTIHRIMEYEP